MMMGWLDEDVAVVEDEYEGVYEDKG